MARKKPGPAVPAALPAPGSARIEATIRDQQRLLAAAATALEAAAVEDVHRGRVAARRLRSILKTFRPLLEPRRDRRYRTDLRRFAQALGEVREADVRRDLLLDLVRADQLITPADRRRLGVLLDDQRIAARESLRRHSAEPAWGSLCAALERHRRGSALFAVRDAGMGEIVALVAAAWRRPVRLLRAKPTATAELHELRLAFKHCRYALEVVADVAPKPTARLLRRLRAAQDRIGEHRDTLLAAHWVRLHGRSLGRPLAARMLLQLEARESKLRSQSADLAARVLDAWRQWRDATRRIRKAGSRDRP
jgi:CHAD domain-containing protein